MSLSLKAELETWAAALKAYDEQDFQAALNLFSRIADSSKILTNMGLIYATIGEHETAVEHFVAATNLDPYLAIAHFQCGVSHFLLQRYNSALLNFEDAHLYLRGNEAINYDQLGLKFKLFSSEIMFNKGLAQLNLGYVEQGLADMQEASRLKVTDEHHVIDEAIRDRGEGYTVFSIPVGVLYRPSENKLKNSKTKDYLGKAKLVAASDSNDAFTEFTGAVKLQQASAERVDNKEDEKKANVEWSPPGRSATVPPPRTDPILRRPTAHEPSKTTPQLHPDVRLDTATILTSRRSQSVSNPIHVPPPPPFEPDLSRSNVALGRSKSTRLANTSVMPLRVKTPQSIASGVTGIDADSCRAGGEPGTVAGGTPTILRPNLRRPKVPGVPLVPHQPASQPLSRTVQPGQYVNTVQSVTPLVLPAVPAPAQGEGHLTQFYNTYMDVYTDDQTSRSAIPRPPTALAQSGASLPQKRSPAGSTFYQPQPQIQEQQQPPVWVQSVTSPVRSSSNTSSSSGMSRAPSRATDAGMINESSIVGMGGANSMSAGTLRRKVTRRPTVRRVTVYEDEDGDDGFVMGEYEEIEMANIRVKLHYQGDVRGMTIPPTTSFQEFVERVTMKFGTSLAGLRMKFTDEDGTKVSLRDDGDFELAIETSREGAKRRSEGKIEVWCMDV